MGLIFVLFRELILNRGAIMTRAGPLLYLTFFTLITYSLSAGNAGTTFRYRTHIVAVAFCAWVAMWCARREMRDVHAEQLDRGNEPPPYTAGAG